MKEAYLIILLENARFMHAFSFKNNHYNNYLSLCQTSVIQSRYAFD